MDTFNVTSFLQQMRDTLRQKPDAPLAADIVDLILSEPTSRGALLLLLTQMLDLSSAPAPEDKTRWFEDIDAFIDLETDVGIQAAARAYPHVWWAVWEDDDCLATYLALREIEHDIHRGKIKPLQLFPTRSIDLWSFPQQVFTMMFPAITTPQLRPVLRGPEEEKVLAERAIDLGNGITCQMTLSALPIAGDTFPLIARAVPPLTGWLVLTLGDQIIRARFDVQGHAMLSAVPVSLLAPSDGPDLRITLELDET
jgi:hypothetical protein